jgi:hypothetical protein
MHYAYFIVSSGEDREKNESCAGDCCDYFSATFVHQEKRKIYQ